VPVWFSHFGTYNGVYKNWGHVAIYKDGTIWSSPISHKPYADIWTSIEQVEQRYNCKFIGWSEDIGNVRVIEEEDMTIPDADNYYWRYGQDLAERLRGRQLSRDEFRQHLVGQTDLRAIEILSDDPEADTTQHAQTIGVVALRDNWQGQIYDLQARTAELGKSVTIKDDEIKKLTAQLAVQSGDTQLLNGFGAWLTKIIVRLGLKG